MNQIELTKVSKVYGRDESEVRAVSDISLRFEKGGFYVVTGPSGCGKTTLLSIVGLLLRPDAGGVTIDGKAVDFSSGRRLARLRARHIGFVFQNFNLLPYLSALDNVKIAASIGKKNGSGKDGAEVLELLGLGNRLHHLPRELSGGEQQRVSIARALINDPEIILADEPTGNLDSKHGREIMELLRELNQDLSKTVVMVTHDMSLTSASDALVRMADGVVEGQ